jgi:AraC-like DNA-binding protein
MPSSTVHTFADPDAYHANIRRTQVVEGVVTARGRYRSELTRTDLHRLWMQRGDETLARVLHFTPSGKRVPILFATDQRQAAMLFSGLELSPDEIVVIGYGTASHHRTSGTCRWGAISLTLEDLVAAGQTIIGRELTAPPFTHRIRPPSLLLSRMRSLHEAASHLAKTAPDILEHPEVARALEQALVRAMVLCISGGEAAETRSAHHRQAVIMRRFEEVLEANPDRTLYAAELCAATGASDRTLRACCREYLGMSPMRYLRPRRMHLARRALRTADPATTTVTEIATNYGFWELGRFSATYRPTSGYRASTPRSRRRCRACLRSMPTSAPSMCCPI